ncbi:hypothetical protein [Bradyrhizobium sp. 25ACV]
MAYGSATEIYLNSIGRRAGACLEFLERFISNSSNKNVQHRVQQPEAVGVEFFMLASDIERSSALGPTDGIFVSAAPPGVLLTK